MDEIELMDKASEALNDLMFGLQVVAVGLALIRLGYDAGLKRGWRDKETEGHECRTTASRPQSD